MKIGIGDRLKARLGMGPDSPGQYLSRRMTTWDSLNAWSVIALAWPLIMPGQQ